MKKKKSIRVKITSAILIITIISSVNVVVLTSPDTYFYLVQAYEKPLDNIKDNSHRTSHFFTVNKNQFPKEVRFQTQLSEATIYFCNNTIISVLHKSREKLHKEEGPLFDRTYTQTKHYSRPQQVQATSIITQFIDANKEPILMGEEVLPQYINYFLGENSKNWVTQIPTYKTILYKEIYPKIDLRYYFDTNGSLKYDFIVQPGGDPSNIKIKYEGIHNLTLTTRGDIQIKTTYGSVYEKKPFIYQEIDGKKQTIPGGYSIQEPAVFGFNILSNYNTTQPLIIDPELAYSTYFGGTHYDYGNDITVDANGNVYIIGVTTSYDFPTKKPFDGILNGTTDVFISKLSPSTGGANSLIFSTYLGGTQNDLGSGIALDSDNNIYITGNTNSPNYPLAYPYDSTYNGGLFGDAFVTKISADGTTLLFSTYLGGSDGDLGVDIDIDESKNIYLVGDTRSANFPTTPNAYDRTYNGDGDIFVAKFSPPSVQKTYSLIYSTFLGGNEGEYSTGIAIDNNGHVYISGATESQNFPTVNAFDESYNGGGDAGPYDVIMAKISTTQYGQSSLTYSTYLGGSNHDDGGGIAIDIYGNAYLTGWTWSDDFPVLNPIDEGLGQWLNCDIFVTKLSPDTGGPNSLCYSTYLGGIGVDVGYDIAVDNEGKVYITGMTYSSNFPRRFDRYDYPPVTFDGYDITFNGWHDAFIAILNPTSTGNLLFHGTYLGGERADEGRGITLDDEGNIYIIGNTGSYDFPVVNPYDCTYNGGDGGYFSMGDIIIAKYSIQ